MDRDALNTYLAEYLNCQLFNDYAPNGLQVEGKTEIKTLVSGVTASKQLIEAAIDLNADAIIVHHGYFWRGEPSQITGQKKQRIGLLLQHNMNLFAYHLPLDAHPNIGNNAQLAHRWGLTTSGSFGDQRLGQLAKLDTAIPLQMLTHRIETSLSRSPLVIGNPEQLISTVAWCSGGAQSYLQSAHAAGADVFITGEISEHCVHFCREMNIAYIAAGHHATERYGVMALGEHLAKQFNLMHHFIDIDNPV